MQFDSLLEQYDELVLDVLGSSPQFLQGNLKRWLKFLDASPPFSKIILQQIEPSGHFESWYEKYRVGRLAAIEWPEETPSRLAMQLALFRRIASGEINAGVFALTVLGVGPKVQSGISEILQQIFVPLSKELRRFLVSASGSGHTRDVFVPASDRIVMLDHNADAYVQVIETLDRLVTAIEGANDYPDSVEKERQIAELSAGRSLLRVATVRVTAAVAVLQRPLLWLGEKFAGGLVGQLAAAAWHLVRHLLGV